MDHVIDEAHVAIDEIIPGPGFLPQTAVDKLTVDIPQGHGRASSREEGTCRVRREPVSQVEQLVIPNFTTFHGIGKRSGNLTRRTGKQFRFRPGGLVVKIKRRRRGTPSRRSAFESARRF